MVQYFACIIQEFKTKSINSLVFLCFCLCFGGGVVEAKAIRQLDFMLSKRVLSTKYEHNNMQNAFDVCVRACAHACVRASVGDGGGGMRSIKERAIVYSRNLTVWQNDLLLTSLQKQLKILIYSKRRKQERTRRELMKVLIAKWILT